MKVSVDKVYITVTVIATSRNRTLWSLINLTTTDAPVTSRISLILEPPLPMSDPHCDAGTMSRKVTDPGFPEDDPESDLCEPDPSSSSFLQIKLKDLKIDSVGPVTVTILSGIDPSEMWIFAPESSLILLMISPPLPMIDPTSFPVINIRMVRVTLGASAGRGLSISDMVRGGVELVEEERFNLTRMVSSWADWLVVAGRRAGGQAGLEVRVR